jgi:hypothetical protein
MAKCVTVLLLLLFVAAARADEEYVVTTPAPRADDVVARWAIDDLRLRGGQGGNEAQVTVRLVGLRADGACARDGRGECKVIQANYAGQQARQLMDQLNTLDLRTNSLRRRIMTRLETDGYLDGGGIAGTPGLPTETRTVTPTFTQTQTVTQTPTRTANSTPEPSP